MRFNRGARLFQTPDLIALLRTHERGSSLQALPAPAVIADDHFHIEGCGLLAGLRTRPAYTSAVVALHRPSHGIPLCGCVMDVDALWYGYERILALLCEPPEDLADRVTGVFDAARVLEALPGVRGEKMAAAIGDDVASWAAQVRADRNGVLQALAAAQTSPAGRLDYVLLYRLAEGQDRERTVDWLHEDANGRPGMQADVARIERTVAYLDETVAALLAAGEDHPPVWVFHANDGVGGPPVETFPHLLYRLVAYETVTVNGRSASLLPGWVAAAAAALDRTTDGAVPGLAITAALELWAPHDSDGPFYELSDALAAAVHL